MFVMAVLLFASDKSRTCAQVNGLNEQINASSPSFQLKEGASCKWRGAMLPKKAVIYYRDILDRTYSTLVAKYSGMEVIAEVFEEDTETNSCLGAFLEEIWSDESKDEVVFPYTIVLHRDELLSSRVRRVILRNVLGIVHAREVWPVMIEPDEFGIPVCSNIGGVASTFLMDGHETICPHVYDGWAEKDQQDTVRGCKFEGEVAVCPHRADFSELRSDHERFLKQMVQKNYKVINLHFFDLRSRLEKWEDGTKGAQRVSNAARAYKVEIYAKMCAWLDAANRALSHDDIVDNLIAHNIRTTIKNGKEFDICRLSKLLSDIDMAEDWRRRKDAKGAVAYRQLHPHR
jgi:hypothetical protein